MTDQPATPVADKDAVAALAEALYQPAFTKSRPQALGMARNLLAALPEGWRLTSREERDGIHARGFREAARLSRVDETPPDALREALRTADEAASKAHDYIQPRDGETPPSRDEANAAIWTIHNALRPLLNATPPASSSDEPK